MYTTKSNLVEVTQCEHTWLTFSLSSISVSVCPSDGYCTQPDSRHWGEWSQCLLLTHTHTHSSPLREQLSCFTSHPSLSIFISPFQKSVLSTPVGKGAGLNVTIDIEVNPLNVLTPAGFLRISHLAHLFTCCPCFLAEVPAVIPNYSKGRQQAAGDSQHWQLWDGSEQRRFYWRWIGAKEAHPFLGTRYMLLCAHTDTHHFS